MGILNRRETFIIPTQFNYNNVLGEHHSISEKKKGIIIFINFPISKIKVNRSRTYIK